MSPAPRTRSLFVMMALWGVGCREPDGRVASVRLSVFAASSLTDAFEDIESEFERRHPEVDVRATFAGSQVLRLQIEQGADADVFASADADHTAALRAAGLVSAMFPFASNHLVVITPRDNPAGLQRFEDLPDAERIVLGNASVPVGRASRALLERGGAGFAASVRESVVSEENNVRLVRTKVELGEADAAIVYRTDVSPKVHAVELPARLDVPVRYHIAAIAADAEFGGRDAVADAFVDFVRSESGQTILVRHGFDREGA